jgi:hypothetical protein
MSSSIRTIPSALESHQILRKIALAGYTADRELTIETVSPCPEDKIYVLFI